MGEVSQLILSPIVAIHVVQNHHAGEQESHWDKTNKRNYHLKLYMPFIVTFALQHGSFVPGEWLAAKGSCLPFYRTQNTREDVYSQVVLILCVHVNLLGTESLGCRSASESHIGVNSGLKHLSEESIVCSRGSGGGE